MRRTRVLRTVAACLFALVLVALVKSVPTDPGNVTFLSAGKNWEASTGVIFYAEESSQRPELKLQQWRNDKYDVGNARQRQELLRHVKA